jgi:hypothetical protein
MNKHQTDWTTQVFVPQWLKERARYHADVHMAAFIPRGWPGKGKVVDLLLPECELQFVARYSDDPGKLVIAVNRPAINRDPEYWMQVACKQAKKDQGPLFLACDTAQQVAEAVALAEKFLPKHYRRFPIERLYDPKDRVDRPLS